MLAGHYAMLARTLNSLGRPARPTVVARRPRPPTGSCRRSPAAGAPHERLLDGRRVVITGAARGIGALTSATRLHARGARVALLGLEPACSRGRRRLRRRPWFECDVADRAAVDAAVAGVVERLGGLDVAVANAGIGAQMPLIGGDAAVWDATVAVNLMGTYNLVRAAGPHVSHPGGYFLVTASLAAAVHLPLMAAYCASKAAVESLGDSLRIELRPSGARAGVAYYAELDTDMTSRGFATKAARGCRSAVTATSPSRRRARDRRARARHPPAIPPDRLAQMGRGRAAVQDGRAARCRDPDPPRLRQHARRRPRGEPPLDHAAARPPRVTCGRANEIPTSWLAADPVASRCAV